MHFYIKTTRIDLGFPFAASAAVILMLDKSGTALLVFICCVLHEAGHILLLTLCSAPPDAIILGVFGMRIERGEVCLDYRREAVCALAGPAANFIVSLAALPFIVSIYFSTALLASNNLCVSIREVISLLASTFDFSKQPWITS